MPLTVRVRRRMLLALPLLLAACEDTTPPPEAYPPLTYGYLSKIRLLVANIDIEASRLPPQMPDNGHVEALAPVSPIDALRNMAQDRLVAVGNAGKATFTIDEASLTRAPGGFAGAMTVRLDVLGADGLSRGFAVAHASRTYVNPDTSDEGTRNALYTLVKLMMNDMNVEFEYQVKRKLRAFLQVADSLAPAPAPVEQQDLGGSAPMPPPPGAPPALPAQ